MKALILAAGYGTRLANEAKTCNGDIPEDLRKIILNYPKPLLPVKGKTIIDHAIERAKDYVSEIYLVSNAFYIDKYCEWRKKYNGYVDVTVLNDGTMTNESRLGAINDISFSLNYMGRNDDLMIIGGDNLIGDRYDGLFQIFYENKSSVIGVYDVKDIEKAKRHGIVAVDEKGKVIEFEEKPAQPKSTLCNTCVYVFKKDDLPLIDEFLIKNPTADAPGYFVKYLSENRDVYTWVVNNFYDIGNLKCYLEAMKDFDGQCV